MLKKKRMPRPKKKILNDPPGLTTGPGQDFWQNRLNDIRNIGRQPEPPTVVRRVLDDVPPPAQPHEVPPNNIPEIRLRTRQGVRMPTTRRPGPNNYDLDLPDEYREPPTDIPKFEPTPPVVPRRPPPVDFPMGRGVPRGNVLDDLPVNNPTEPRLPPAASEPPFLNQPEPPSDVRIPFNEPTPVARPPPVTRPPPVPRAPVQPPSEYIRPPPERVEIEFEPDLELPEWTQPIQEFAFNAGRAASNVGRVASTAGRAAATAAGEAGVAAGEALAGVGGAAFGLEGGAAILAGGGIIGAGVLAAGLLGYGVYLLGKRLHDKFKAAHDKHGQEAALAALARKVDSDRGLRMKFEKNLSPEDMQVLNDHITLHTEVDLGTAKRKKTDSSSGQKDEISEKEERRAHADDDSTSTIHGMYKQSEENTSTSQIADTPTNKSESKNTSNDIPTTGTPAEDKQMFQPPEPEKPINVAPQQPPPQPPPQQPRQSFQDNSINSIRPLNTQQQPRLSAEQYQYVRQRDPGYMV